MSKPNEQFTIMVTPAEFVGYYMGNRISASMDVAVRFADVESMQGIGFVIKTERPKPPPPPPDKPKKPKEEE